MTVVIDGTLGVQSVNGTAAAPSVTGTDTDTGIVYGTNTVTIATGGTAGLIQNANQNLGLGVTPQSDWTTTNGIKVFQIGAGAVSSVSALNDVNIFSNVYADTSNVYKYLNTTQATIYRQVNGEHWWLTAPSGTAGTTATMLQAMTLTNGGNLGVNATSPISLGSGYTSITTSNTTGGGLVMAASGVAKGALFNGAQNIYLDANDSSGSVYFRNTATGATTTISPYGNWGFGTAVPSSWYSGFAGLDISAAGAISGSNGGVILWGNLYINSSAQLIRKTTGYTTRYVSAADIGEHLFYTGPYAASGGGVVTETNVARIDASGNLTIAGSISAGGQFNSNATVTISALNTGYAIGNGPWAGAMTARDNTYGGSGLWVQDPNGNGGVAVSAGSSWVNGAYTVYYSGGTTYIKKTSGNVPVSIAYSILYV